MKNDNSIWRVVGVVLTIAVVFWLTRDNSQHKYDLELYNRTVQDQFVPEGDCRECIQQYMDNKRAYEKELEQDAYDEFEANQGR